MARGRYIYVVYDEGLVKAVFTVKYSALDYVEGNAGFFTVYRYPDGEYGDWHDAVKIYPKERVEKS